MKNGVNGFSHPRRLAFFSLGFFRPKLRRMMRELGFALIPFGIGTYDAIVVWGRKPVSKRGRSRAQKRGCPLLTLEDGFIRSIAPGWQEAPRALILDWQGVYFDQSTPSDWVDCLKRAQDAKAQMELQALLGVSKYNQTPRGRWSREGYVLLVDQVEGDQSITYGQADASRFKAALDFAKMNHPDAPILLRTHPAGRGYYHAADGDGSLEICSEAVNPFDLIDNALSVIVVTSQMGFDAIIAGKKPVVFGAPFFAGLGLSDDHFRAGTQITHRPKCDSAKLYDAAMNQYCHFFAQDGTRSDALSEIFALDDERRQLALAHQPLRLKNQRAWKIPHMKRFFPKQNGTQILRWGARKSPEEWVVEDGFLRSRGLGAKLVPPLSLIVDKTGIYFDPHAPCDLEAMIKARRSLHPLQKERAQNLQSQIIKAQISKYNLPSDAGYAPKFARSPRPVVLVVGQVEDDRSILLGATGAVKTNAELLKAARRDFPKHHIIYKSHPDVEAGLRKGALPQSAHQFADEIYEGEGIEALWPHIDALATITSLSGFEALLRGKSVSCYGMPFYADWGLTRDHAPSTGRRGKASLAALIYASLIDYPLYLDPKTRRFTTPEVIIKRIRDGETDTPVHLKFSTFIQQKFYRLRDAARRSASSK